MPKLPITAEPAGAAEALELTAVWPPEADFILSALDAGVAPPSERRAHGRFRWRAVALLRLHSDALGSKPWELFTGDAGPRGLRFITRHRLPLGYGGLIRLRAPRRHLVSIACTVQRCRPTIHEWFEGAVQFNRYQDDFSTE